MIVLFLIYVNDTHHLKIHRKIMRESMRIPRKKKNLPLTMAEAYKIAVPGKEFKNYYTEENESFNNISSSDVKVKKFRMVPVKKIKKYCIRSYSCRYDELPLDTKQRFRMQEVIRDGVSVKKKFDDFSSLDDE